MSLLKNQDLLRFQLLIVFEGKRDGSCVGGVGTVNRSRLVTEMIHGLTLRHAGGPGALGPGVTITLQLPVFDARDPASARKFCRPMARRPFVKCGKEAPDGGH